jgi:SPX domain protein involved in polyphosphate accumulation
MAEFETRFERLELKFLIDEIEAERIRRQLLPYCEIDPHSTPALDGGSSVGDYQISSLYLDSPGLAFHRAKERGDSHRIKLRVRWYSQSSPAALELKSRHAEVIDKTRAAVDRRHVEDVTLGLVRPEEGDANVHVFLNEFSRIVAESGAGPTLTVRYRREAWESVVDDYARVTFDRRIQVRRTDDWRLSLEGGDWCHFDDHWRTSHLTTPVVLEIKCRSAVPIWVIDLIRQNSLCRTSFSKYSIGIQLTERMLGHPAGYSRSAKVMQ